MAKKPGCKCECHIECACCWSRSKIKHTNKVINKMAEFVLGPSRIYKDGMTINYPLKKQY